MPRFEHGIKRAITEIIGGLVIATILNAFISSGLLDPSYLFLFKLLNMIGTIALILAMPYWGAFYLLGWLFGLLTLSQSGLIGISARAKKRFSIFIG